MIDKVNNNLQNILGKVNADKNQPRSVAENEQADASLESNYQSLIEKAVNSAENQAKAVESAKKLLLSGELDSPQNIRKAAENIAQFGI